jgi:hypothetical protein
MYGVAKGRISCKAIRPWLRRLVGPANRARRSRVTDPCTG